MCQGVLENRDDEQVAVRQADASGGDIRQNQHEENRMRDIHVGKRGSEAAGGEQPDMLRKTVRFEQEAPVQQRLPTQLFLWKILRVVRHKIGRGPYLCTSRVMLVTTYKFLRWMHATRWCRGEDAGYFKRSELNELVENLTCLNALERKIWKRNQKVVTNEKSWKTGESNQKIEKNWFRTA